MGRNTSNGYRIGAVKERSQVFNDRTGQFIKRDTTSGKFISASNNKFKGVTVEKNKPQAEKNN